MDPFETIRRDITNAPENAWARDRGYEPVYTASAQSRIIVVGQAPGHKAQASGIPWNDQSGETLRAWLGVTRERFYDDRLFALMPMDFYYPGKGKQGDKPPRKDFATTWHPRLLAHMPDVQLFLLVGRYAQAYYLGDQQYRTLTETVAHFDEYLPIYLPLVHPSPLNIGWQKKNPWFETDVIPVLRQRVAEIIG